MQRLAGGDEALFRYQGVLHAHLAHIIIVREAEAPGKGPALLALGGGLDVLVGGEMVHDHHHTGGVKDLVEAGLFKLVDGDGGSDVVSQYHVQFGLDHLSCPNLRQPGVGCQNFLCHGHAHDACASFCQAAAAALLIPLI